MNAELCSEFGLFMGVVHRAAPTIIALPRLLNIKEAAHVLHISVRTVHTLIKNKQLTYFRVRGQLRFDPVHLNDYLGKRMVQAA
jgi:excisionase family DNA binding protein